jgi:hypothetical protein
VFAEPFRLKNSLVEGFWMIAASMNKPTIISISLSVTGYQDLTGEEMRKDYP